MGCDVSVIIPAYNYGNFLEECLESVFRQKGVSLEVIVVDDGSTDNTSSILKPYYDRIEYIYQDNAGLSAARNTGIRNSSGRYLQFLDADDLLAPGTLISKLRAMDDAGENTIGVCKTMTFLYPKSTIPFRSRRPWLLYTTNLNTHLCRINIAPPHAYFTPAEAVQKAGYFNEKYKGCEDYDFWLRCLGANYDFVYIPGASVLYRRHGASMGSRKSAAGSYPFDVLVHQKKHDHVYGGRVDDELETIEGNLALINGALISAFKIDPESNQEGINELVTISMERLAQVKALSSAAGYSGSLEARLYLNRVSMIAQKLSVLERPDLTDALRGLFSDELGFGGGVTDLRFAFPFNRYEKQSLLLSSFKSRMRIL